MALTQDDLELLAELSRKGDDLDAVVAKLAQLLADLPGATAHLRRLVTLRDAARTAATPETKEALDELAVRASLADAADER